ncbi:pyridoxine 5'-phosphate synthase [bacterium]|nr:pyridoxine 5'-phosphate synthase [bacterium]
MKLSINLDHVATIRQQRKEGFPEPYFAAIIAEKAGIDGITLHLREDRRHTNDNDVKILKAISKRLNLEMALNDEIIKIAKSTKPAQVTLVPEKRQELTTEGGLNIAKYKDKLAKVIKEFRKLKIDVSLFVEPDKKTMDLSKEVGADIVELHTGTYANAYLSKNKGKIEKEINRINKAVAYAHSIGLRVHIGHGLTIDNIQPFAKNELIEEASIGHFLIGLAIYEGLENAIKKMRNIL